MKKLNKGVVLAIALLSGCAQNNNQPFEIMQHHDAKSMLAELQKIDKQRSVSPNDISLRTRRQLLVTQLANDYLQRADRAVDQNDYVSAAHYWQSVLDYQPGNQRAQQGLKKMNAYRAMDTLYNQAVLLRDTDPEQALKNIQKILEESPGWPQAAEMRDHLLREIAVQNQPEMRLSRELRKTVSFNFERHNLRAILANISDITGINIIYDNDVPYDLTASLVAHNTSAENALNLLLLSNQLRKKVLNANTILIYPASPQKENIYRDTVVKTVFLSYAKAKDLNVALRSLIRIRDVHIDERTNSITFRGARENVEKAEQLLVTLDRPESEVTLAVEVLEVNSKDVENLGINYPGQVGIGFNSKSDNSSNIDLRGVNKNNMFVNLGASAGLTADMQKVRSHARVLANPRIRVKNHMKAVVDIGERIPVLTSTVSDGFSQEKVEYQDVGLKLDVTPDTSLDGSISMDVNFNLSTIGSAERSKDGVAYYRTNNRQASTSLSSQNGETQMLAGLIKSSNIDGSSGLPGLSSLPFLGKLFGSEEKNSEKTEVILLITPIIERNIDLPGTHFSTIDMGSEESQGESGYLPPPESTRATEQFTPPPLAPPAMFPTRAAIPAPVMDNME